MFRNTGVTMMRASRWKLTRTLSSQSPAVEVTRDAQRDVPRPNALPFVGTRLALLAGGGAKRLHEYIDNRHKQLGPIFSENLSGADMVFTCDPEHMRTLFIKLEGKHPVHILPEPWVIYNEKYGTKRGLFFMDGDEWLHNRKIANKLLLKETSEAWLEGPIRDVTGNLVEKLKGGAVGGVVTPDLDRQFYRFSIDVLISILTGTAKCLKTHHYDFLLNVFGDKVQQIFKHTADMYLWPSLYAKYDHATWQQFKHSVDYSLKLSRKLVKEIVALRSDYQDGLVCKLLDENVPEEDITRIVADFVIAAGDTTAYTLQWTLYLLANHPEVVSELRKSREDKYALSVVREAMRLYPVAPFLTRILPKASSLGPYNLKEGTPVIGSIYTSGRSSAYFSEPERFAPERWERDESVRLRLPVHTPSASLPFALGARSCIGRKIAQLQLTNAVKAISENFDLKLLNKEKVEAITSMVLVPKDPIKIELMLRNVC